MRELCLVVRVWPDAANPRPISTPDEVRGVQAALVLYGAEQATQLLRAVDSRDVIGQAKGILMERHHTDDGAPPPSP